jgi:hypothetical protein
MENHFRWIVSVDEPEEYGPFDTIEGAQAFARRYPKPTTIYDISGDRPTVIAHFKNRVTTMGRRKRNRTRVYTGGQPVDVEGTDAQVIQEGDMWIVVLGGERHVFASNAEAWRWLDRHERRTSWRTPFYAA